MVNWSALSPDLLVQIAKRVKLLDDFVAFRGVCSSWRSAANMRNFMFKYDQLPLLMLAPRESSNRRDFFNISKGVSRQVCLPEANDKKTLSSKGWLLTIDRDWRIFLLHLYSRVRIELPNIKSFEDWDADDCISPNIMRLFFLHKFVLSSSPLEDEDYIVMVIYGCDGKLAYFKPGCKTWITVHPTCSQFMGFSDVFYYQSKFYAIDFLGQLMVCDFSSDNCNPVDQLLAEMPSGLVRTKVIDKLYLVVVSHGVFWVIQRHGVSARPGSNCTTGNSVFHVFEVKLSTNSSSWFEIKDLGNRSLFVGHNSSFSVVSHISDCKPNCIYFTDDFPESCWWVAIEEGVELEGAGKDMGIYCIQDGSIVPHFEGESYHFLSPPMWVERSFN
ncbi:F-box protein [Melia azedarach]|uniref:F-box protein n=1 Tax=Melia azedarach TaxID=155640 RepID=A0ACC1XKR7_MELAZ|nr:F-box protein [Melia azedarach]